MLCLQKLFHHWWCFDCASIMMVHITGYEVFSRGGGVNGGRSIYRNWGRAWCSFLYQLHVCVVCVLGLGWVDISKTSNHIVYSATEIDYICWFRLQLTLLLMNSISSPARRRSPAISFFSYFSIYMLSVFLFVIKLTSPFSSVVSSPPESMLKELKTALDGACDDVWALVCIYRRFHVILN